MDTPSAHDKLAHFPISFFATVMGLSGLTIATEKAEHVWQTGHFASPWLLGLTVLVFLGIAAVYLIKLATRRASVMEEFNHPIRLSFFPATSIGLILIAIAAYPYLPGVSLWLWGLGTVAHLLFTLTILSLWMHHDKFQIQHSNPAWFIPIVGNILVPVIGVDLGFPEVSWFFFSVGLLFWVVLLTILMNRYFFHNPMPAKLLPTLFIFIAPPAVGFISWLKLNGGEIDAMGRFLYYIALFTTLLLFFQFRHFAKVKFAMPWWAYSFPMAAIAIASMLMYQKIGGSFFAVLSLILLAALALLIVVLIINTLAAMKRGEVCVPE
ncbi:MAG: SLAC1 anion channel family protein [Halothiobacillaceae bacterium]|nr:SLAC1 anion channel family protein [Halothiobacillaceae bacterium]